MLRFFYRAEGRACFRCLFPQPPEQINDCNSAGVLGVLPGLMGLIQTTEALKYLLGLGQQAQRGSDKLPAGDSLSNHLLLVDAVQMNFGKITLQPDPQCGCQQAPVNIAGAVLAGLEADFSASK